MRKLEFLKIGLRDLFYGIIGFAIRKITPWHDSFEPVAGQLKAGYRRFLFP